MQGKRNAKSNIEPKAKDGGKGPHGITMVAIYTGWGSGFLEYLFGLACVGNRLRQLIAGMANCRKSTRRIGEVGGGGEVQRRRKSPNGEIVDEVRTKPTARKEHGKPECCAFYIAQYNEQLGSKSGDKGTEYRRRREV